MDSIGDTRHYYQSVWWNLKQTTFKMTFEIEQNLLVVSLNEWKERQQN